MSIAKQLEAVLQGRDEVMMRGAYGVELFAKRLKNDELTLSMRGANGWELLLMTGGACEYSRTLFLCVAETVAAMLRDEVEAHAALCAPSSQNGAEPPQAPETVNAPATPQKAKVGPRCPHYASIRRVFAIAGAAGLDTKADEAMRAAFGRYLGRAISSRAAMNGADWSLIGTAIKSRELTW